RFGFQHRLALLRDRAANNSLCPGVRDQVNQLFALREQDITPLVGDIMGHRALVRRLLTGSPLKPVLFQSTPNVPAVCAVLICKGETFDPETQTGMAVFLSMLWVPADMLVQYEGFLREEFSMDEQQIPIVLNGFEHIEIVRLWADGLNEVLSV
ncbi:hypothetical protein BBO99_00004534, partial [Phytophthora kernoviae]